MSIKTECWDEKTECCDFVNVFCVDIVQVKRLTAEQRKQVLQETQESLEFATTLIRELKFKKMKRFVFGKNFKRGTNAQRQLMWRFLNK